MLARVIHALSDGCMQALPVLVFDLSTTELAVSFTAPQHTSDGLFYMHVSRYW